MNARNRLRLCLFLIATSILSWAESAPACAPPLPTGANCVALASSRTHTGRRMPLLALNAVAGVLGAAFTVGFVGRAFRWRKTRRLRRSASPNADVAVACGSIPPSPPQVVVGTPGRRRVRRCHYDRFYLAMTRDL